MKETITVTQEDIDTTNAMRAGGNEFRYCAVTYACQRSRPNWNTGAIRWEVDILRVNGQPVVLPEETRTFIERFDNNEPVKPFSFTIEVPE